MSNLYENITLVRKAAGIKSDAALCDMARVPRSSMSDLKNGRTKSMSYDKVARIAEACNVPIERIVSGAKEQASLTPSFDGEVITRTAKGQPNRVQEVFGEKITFIAKDNAMIFDCIPNGATLTLNPHFDLENGDIIVACIDDEFYCRRYSADGNNVTLYSSNPKYPPIFTTLTNLYKSGNGILGVVKKVSFEI